MDRFDEMRAKNGGSGSENYQEKTVIPSAATQEVVADMGFEALSKVKVEGDSNLISGNIKQGVSIFGVAGSFVASLNNIGSSAVVRANNTISEGAPWVGTKNDDYTPTWMQVTRTNLPAAVSDDFEVGINTTQNISSSSTSVDLYFYNSETTSYDTVAIPLPEFTTDKNLTGANINGSGDLAFLYSKNTTTSNTAFIMLEIDKEKKTATPYVFYMTKSYSFGGSYSSDIHLYGKVIFFSFDATIYDKETHQIIPLTKSAGFNLSLLSVGYHTGKILFKDNKLLLPYQGGFNVYTIDDVNKTISCEKINLYSSYTGGTNTMFSRNGKRVVYKDSTSNTNATNLLIYDLDLDNMIVKKYLTHSAIGNGYIDGDKLLRNGSIIDISNPNDVKTIATVSTTAPTKTSGFNINMFYSGALYMLPSGEENVEYIIEQAVSSTLEADKVYGVASSRLNPGEIGTAQKLFDTYATS